MSMKTIFGSILLAGALASAAQNPAQLTFEEAVKLGLERNVTLKQQKNQLELNQAQKMAGYGNFLPGINITSAFQQQAGQQPNTTTGNLEDLKTTYVGAQLNGNVTVFNGLRNVNALGQASNLLMAQSYLVKRSTQDVVSMVALQYLQVLLDQELLKIAEGNLTSQNTLLEQMQGFYDVGTRAITDVYSQDALMKAGQVAVIRAKNNLQNDKAQLAQILQLDPAQDFEVINPSFQLDLDDIKNMSLDSLLGIAVANRADLAQSSYQVKANQFAYKSLSSNYLPSVSVFANYGSFYYSEIPLNFGEQFRSLNPSFSYGANLTIPIFSRFANKAQRMASEVQFKNSELTRQNLERTVKIDVQRAQTNLINALETLSASQSQFQAGELALQTQKESYELGVTNQVALAQANQVYVQGASSKAQAEVTVLFQRILLDYALGTLKVDDLIAK
jgi:outer membrane protein